MNIAEEVSFGNDGQIERSWSLRRLFMALVIILVASLSFAIGRLTAVGKSEPISIEYDASLGNAQAPMPNDQSMSQTATVYASSKGKKYYYANCSGLSRISAANKVSFASAAAAEAAGLTLASNCSQ